MCRFLILTIDPFNDEWLSVLPPKKIRVNHFDMLTNPKMLIMLKKYEVPPDVELMIVLNELLDTITNVVNTYVKSGMTDANMLAWIDSSRIFLKNKHYTLSQKYDKMTKTFNLRSYGLPILALDTLNYIYADKLYKMISID